MSPETIKKLCCPFDHTDLKLTSITVDVEQNIQTGFLICNACRRIYPIIRGIPIMTPDEYRELKLEQPVFDHWRGLLKGKVSPAFRLKGEEPDPA